MIDHSEYGMVIFDAYIIRIDRACMQYFQRAKRSGRVDLLHLQYLTSYTEMGKSDKKEKKEKKRADNEAAIVVVEAEAVTAAGVGAPAVDAGEVSMAVDGETSAVTAAKKDKKSKKDKKDKKDGATSSSKKDKDSSKKEKSKERKELEIPADALSPIAHPLAGRKLNKSTLKLVKRGVWDTLCVLGLVPPASS